MGPQHTVSTTFSDKTLMESDKALSCDIFTASHQHQAQYTHSWLHVNLRAMWPRHQWVKNQCLPRINTLAEPTTGKQSRISCERCEQEELQRMERGSTKYLKMKRKAQETRQYGWAAWGKNEGPVRKLWVKSSQRNSLQVSEKRKYNEDKNRSNKHSQMAESIGKGTAEEIFLIFLPTALPGKHWEELKVPALCPFLQSILRLEFICWNLSTLKVTSNAITSCSLSPLVGLHSLLLTLSLSP